MQLQAINYTLFEQATPDKIVSVCSDISVKPALIIYYILSNLILLCIGMFLVDNKNLFYKIFFSYLLSGIILLLAIMYLPHFVQLTTDFFIKFIK